jgi:hypothetical protein
VTAGRHRACCSISRRKGAGEPPKHDRLHSRCAVADSCVPAASPARFPTVLVGWWAVCGGGHLRSWAVGSQGMGLYGSRLNGREQG